MTVAPLFAQVLPPAPSSARPGRGDSPSDLAGLFALLLASAPPVQPVLAQGADPSASVASALTGDSPPAVPATPPAHQTTPVSGVIGPAVANALPSVCPLPTATAAPVQAAFTPASGSPQLAPASADASLPGPGYAPSAELTRAAPHSSLAEPAHALTETPGAAAPPPLSVAMAPPGTVRTESAPVARPEMTTIALTADTSAPTPPPGLSLQTGTDPAGPPPAAARVRSLAAPGARSVAPPAPEARRPHVSILASTPGPAGDQPAASDHAWLEPGSEAAEDAVTRADHAVSEPARAPAPGRPVPPAPVFQVGVQIAKAVPGRVDRLVVQLEPAALGRVEVRLNFHPNDQVSAVIAAERPDTLDALQRDARLLERSLHQAGLRLDGDGLTFSLKREQAHHQAREENWFAPAADERADQQLRPAPREPAPLHWFRLRALDIRV